MRKFIFVLFATILFSFPGIAQEDDFYTTKPNKKEKEIISQTDTTFKVFMGLGLGVNNSCGMVGTLFEFKLANKFSAIAGLGLSTWGYKGALGTRYYNRGFPHKLFYGLTFTTTSGINDIEVSLETTNSSSETVTLNFKPASNLALTIGYQWRLFRIGRLNFEAGYSIPLQNKAYEVVSPGVTLTNQSETVMAILTPGGIVLGLAFTIGF